MKRFILLILLLTVTVAQADTVTFKLRRDTTANWQSFNPVLAQGEPGCEMTGAPLRCTAQKVGDGVTAWNSLPYTNADFRNYTGAQTTAISAKADKTALDLDVASYPGADMGQKLVACIAAASVSAVCDARHIASASINSAVTVNKAVTVRLPQTVALNATLTVSASDAHIVGNGTQVGTIISVGNSGGIVVGGATPLWRWSLEGFKVQPQSGATPTSGVQLQNAREGLIKDVQPTGFLSAGGTGVKVLENCWSNTYDSVRTTGNDIGFWYAGDQPHASRHIAGMYNSNRIGMYIALGSSSTNGIYIDNAAHFEGNSDVGILAESGSIRLVSSSIYSELLSGNQRLLRARGTGANALSLDLDLKGISVLASANVNPLLLDASVGTTDKIKGSVYATGIAGGATTALADVCGTTNEVLLNGRMDGLSSNALALTAAGCSSTPNVMALAYDYHGLSLNSGDPARTPWLNFRAGASGSSTKATSGMQWFDQYSAYRSALYLGAGDYMYWVDSNNTIRQSMSLYSPGTTDIGGAGTGKVSFNSRPNTGTGGVEFWSGGTTPAKVASIDGTGRITAAGGSANHAICWKADGKTLGYCSAVVAADGTCGTCN